MDLALRAKGGSASALDELIHRHQDWLHRVVRIKLGGAAIRARRFFDSMDIVQETMTIVARKIGELDVRTAAGVRQWLAKIATYQINDSLKYADAEARNPDYEVALRPPNATTPTAAPGLEISSGGTRPDERVWKDELSEILDDAVAQLPAHYQEAVLLRDYAKEDWQSIKERMGKESVGAAKQLYHRAWIKIREIAVPRLGRSED